MTAPWNEAAGQPEAVAKPRRKGGFWRGLRRLVFWSFATLGFLMFCGGMLALFVVWQTDSGAELPDGPIVLTVDLDEGVVERSNPSLGPFGGDEGGIPVRPLIDALHAAAADSLVSAVALNLGTTKIGIATAQDVRGAIAAVVASGKPVYAYAASFGAMSPGTVDYYLASAATEIWMAPSGDLNLLGMMLESPFIGNALDELEVDVQLAQREEYKAAVETFTRAGYSGPARESLQRLVDSLRETVAAGISADRGLPLAAIEDAIDAPPFSAEAAQTAALIDRIGYTDEFFTALEERHPDDELASIQTYMDAIDSAGDPQANVAYIQAIGPVVDQAGDPFDTSVIAPDNVGLALASALEDPAIDAVILRIDSPGGSYTASDAIWRDVIRLREAGKPVVASMGNVAASGGYYIAMGADRIVAQPTTITGSIGVFAGKFVIDAATRNFGITWDRVAAGTNAGMFSWTDGYTPAQWASLNTTLDRIYQDFVRKAAAGRRMGYDVLEAFARGRVWTGADALDHGLIDALGGPAEALAEVRSLLNLAPDAPLAIRILPPIRSPFEQLMDLLREPSAGMAVNIELPAALAPWPEILDFMEQPGAQLRLPPMRIEG